MADRSQLPSVTQYTKNVLKSTLYASSGVAENLMPGYLEFKETNKEVFKAAYVAIRDYRKTFQRVKDAITKSKVYEAAEVGLKNIKSDIRTGMWYNRGRETEFDNQAMMSGDDFGLSDMTGGSKGGSGESGGGDLGFGDIDINMDDIFGDDESGDEENLDITDGDELIADTVKETSAKSTAAINDIQVKGIDVLMKSNRAAANMAYIQSEKMMKITEEGFTTLNTTAANLLKFNTEGLQKHLENAANYYTNTEKLAQERNAMLKELLEMQRNIYAMYQIEVKNKDDSNKPKKYTWGAITTSSGMPALEEYFGAIKQNLDRELDNAGMGMIKAMSGLAGDNPLLAMVQNPLGDFVTMLVATALGPMVSNAAKGLDRTLSSMFGNFIAGMNHLADEGEGPLSLIGKIFGIRDTAKNTLDTANYKRGPLPWDGEAKKALVEVIPHYLANIESALTGRHQLFDYQTGRYVDSAALKDQYLSIVDRYTYQPFSEVDQLMRNFFKTFTLYKSEDQKELVKTWVNMRKYAAGGKGRWKNMFNFDTSNPREDEEQLDDLAMEIGSPKEFVRDILNYLKMASGKGDKDNPAGQLHGQRGVLTEVEGKIMESKERQTRDFTNMEEQGTILNQLFNNGFMQYKDTRGILRNNQTAMDKMHLKYQKDEKGNNIFYYLQHILGSLMVIQTQGFGLGDSKQLKEEMRLRQQRRKIHRGQKTDGLIQPSPTSNNNNAMQQIQTMMNAIRDDEYQKDKTADQLYNESKRREAENIDKRTEEKAKKQAEEKKSGKQVKGPIIVGMDNKNAPDNETYTTLVDAGVRDMHSRNVDEEQVHFAEMTRVMEQMMINGVKEATDRNEANKTWLGRQYAKFKESNDEEDKKYRAEIQKVGFLDALLQADDIGDKWGTIRVGLEDLAEKPSALLTKVLEQADERLYQFFFTEEEIQDKRNGKRYKGFFGRMRAHLDNLFVDMNEGLNKYLFQPLKDKLGVEGPWDAIKKGLGYIGIDVEAVGSELKEGLGENLKSVWENIKDTFTEFFSDAAEAIAEDERKARELEESKKTYTEELVDKFTSSSSDDKKEEKKEETKKQTKFERAIDVNTPLEERARILKVDISGLSEAEALAKVNEVARNRQELKRNTEIKKLERIKNKTQLTDEQKQRLAELQGITTPESTVSELDLARNRMKTGLVSSDQKLKDSLTIANQSLDNSEVYNALNTILNEASDNSNEISRMNKQIKDIVKEFNKQQALLEEAQRGYEDIVQGDTDWSQQSNPLQTSDYLDGIKEHKERIAALETQMTQLIPQLSELHRTHVDKPTLDNYKLRLDSMKPKAESQVKLKGYTNPFNLALSMIEEEYKNINNADDYNGVFNAYHKFRDEVLKKRNQYTSVNMPVFRKVEEKVNTAISSKNVEGLRDKQGNFIKGLEEFSKANPDLVFKAYEPSIREWISGSLGVKNKAAAQHVVDKLRKEFIDKGGDIERILTVKIIKGIVNDIAKAYEENRDNTPIGRSIFESKAGSRLNGIAEEENILDYLNEKDKEYDVVESVDEAAQGITDLNELIKVSLNEESPIYKKLEEIRTQLSTGTSSSDSDTTPPSNNTNTENLLNTISQNIIDLKDHIADSIDSIFDNPNAEIIKNLTQSIENYLSSIKVDIESIKNNSISGKAEGRESLELAPAETAIVSKGEIIKPLVGPSEKITKTGLYNLGRGDAVIPNPSKATIERNKVEESNKLNEISRDLASGNDISKHMATTKAYAKGRDNVYDLDNKKGQEDYVNSIVKSLTEDLPKYAESRPPVRIEATDEAKLNYILSNKNRFISKEFDPEQIAILSAIIKGEKEDNKYKQNEGRVLSNISDMYGYLISTIDEMTQGKNDDDKIKIGNKEASVKELKTIQGFIGKSRQTAWNTEVQNGLSTSTIGKLIGDGINNIKEGAIDVLTGITGLDSENVKKSVKETYAEVKKGMPNVIAKGTVGLIGGTLLGGPLVGALLGSAVGVAQSSETFRTTLFGTVSKRDENGNVLERKDDGLISKETVEAYKKYIPGIKGYGLLGTALGLITPFGLLGGALLGAGFGAISRTDEFQDTFFGKKGILDKDTRDFFKKAAPNAAAAAAGMAFLGPFGLIGNIAVGSVLGLAGSTEKFQTYLFGAKDRDGKRHGGIVGALKKGVVDPWLEFGKQVSKDLFEWIKTDVFAPLKGAIAPIGKQIQLGLTGLVKGLGHVIDHWAKVILGKPITVFMEKWMKRISGGMTKVLGWVLNPVKKIASAPFKLIGGIGDILKRRQIQMGNADYMSAAERMKFRQENAMNQGDQWSSFDEKIATASSKNIQNVLDVAKLMETGGKDLEESKDQSVRELWATIDSTLQKNGRSGLDIDSDEKSRIEKLILSDDPKKIKEASETISSLMGDVAGKDKVLGKIESVSQDVSAKKRAIENFKNYGVDATVKLFREHLGIEADTENISKFRSMLEKELDVRKSQEAKAESGEMTKGENLLTNDAVRDQTAVLSEHLVSIKKVLEALAGGMLSQEDLRDLSKKYEGFDQTIVKAKEKEMNTRLDTRDLMVEAFGEDIVNNMDEKSYARLISDNPKFKGKLGNIFADMARRNFKVDNMNKLTGQSDEIIKRIITLFNKTGLQTDDYEALGKLSDKEFENIINASSTGLNIIDMDEVKDLDVSEADQIRNFRELTGLTDKHISTTVLKKLVRNGRMAMFNADPQAFIDEINANREAFDERLEGKGNLERTGTNRVKGTIKIPNPNTIGNAVLNSISTTGQFGGKVVGKALRHIGHNPIERYEGVATAEESLAKFGSADMLADYIAAGHRSAIERFLDPDNDKGTRPEVEVVDRAVDEARARGMDNKQIENALNIKIKAAPNGGEIVESYNTKAIAMKGEDRGKRLNQEIFELAEKYGMYDDHRKFMDMVMGDNRFQDKVISDLVQQGYTKDEIIGYINSDQFRGGTTPKRQNVENILAKANYTNKQISGFRTGNLSEAMDKDIREILKANNISDEEIENFKKGINGYASGRFGFLSNIKNKVTNFFNKPVVADENNPFGIDERKDDGWLSKIKSKAKGMAVKHLIKKGISSLDLHNVHKEFTNKNLIKTKLMSDAADYFDVNWLNNLLMNPREQFGQYLKGLLDQYSQGIINHESLVGSIYDLLSRNSIESIQQLSNLTPEQITQVLQAAQSMPMFAGGRQSFMTNVKNRLTSGALRYKYRIKGYWENNKAEIIRKLEELAKDTVIEESISQAIDVIADKYPIDSSTRELLDFIADGKIEKLADVIQYLDPEAVNQISMAINQISGLNMFAGGRRGRMIKRAEKFSGRQQETTTPIIETPNVEAELEDIKVPKIENEIKTQFEGIESENSLRFMVYNQVKKFNELGLMPNQEVLGKLDYKNGLVGLINSGFSIKKLFEYDPKNMEVKFTDVEGKEFKVDADFYENMTTEEQSNLMKNLINQAMNKDNKGVVTMPTPDGDKQIKISDDRQGVMSTMYGDINTKTTNDGSKIPSDKDSKEKMQMITKDHESRVHTATVLDDIKDLIYEFITGNKKKKPKQEKKSFLEMLMDLLKILAAFLIGGGLMALLGAASDNLSTLLGRVFKSALKLTEKAIVDAINELAAPLNGIWNKLKGGLEELKVPKLGSRVKGAIGEEAEIAAKLAKIKAGGEGTISKGYRALTEAEEKEFKALQEKGLGSLEGQEVNRFNYYNSMMAEEKEINKILNSIRKNGMDSLTTEELDRLSTIIEKNPTLQRTADTLDDMYRGEQAYAKSLEERLAQIERSKLTFGDLKSNIKQKIFGGASLSEKELERIGLKLSDKGVSNETIQTYLDQLKTQRSGLVRGVNATTDVAKSIGTAVGNEVRAVGDKVVAGFDKAVQPIRDVGNKISETAGKAGTAIRTGVMGSRLTEEEIAQYTRVLQEQGLTQQQIDQALARADQSRRTFLGNIVDRARGIGPVFEGGELNFGATEAAGERGLTEKLASGIVKAHTLPLAALGAAGTAAGGIANAMYQPFKAVGSIASGLDQQLAADLGIKYKAATFAPRMLLGMPGFYVDSVKDTFKTGKELLTGGFNASLGRDIDAALNIGAREALGEGATTSQKIVRAGVEAGESILGPISRGLHQFIGVVAKKLGQFISLVPGLENTRVAKGLLELSDNMAKVIVKKATDRAATFLLLQRFSKFCSYYMAYEVASKIYEGFSNPGVILHIKDQDKISNGLRFVAALANVLSLPTLGFVEPKTIADLCLDVFGDIVGFGEEERKIQEESIEEYETWKTTVAEGGDDSFEAFLKASGTFNDKGLITNVGNFIWEGFKGITSEIPQFIMGKLSEGAESMFKLGDHVRSIKEYWDKLSDRSSAIMDGLGKLSDTELAKLDAGVEIAPDDPLFGIKNTMKDFAANHWFIMGTVGWAIGKIGTVFSGIFDGAGDMINGIKSQLSANFSAMIEGNPLKILDNLLNGDGSESRTGFMNGVGRVVTMIATVPTLTIATLLAPIRLIRTAYEKVEESFEAFPEAKDRLDEMSKLADEGKVTAIWDLNNPFNSNMASGVGDLMAGIMYGIGKTGYMIMGAYNYVANGIMSAVNSAMSWMAGKKIDFNWYDKYELKEILDSEYINHAEVKFDITHPLTAIPSAVESMYKLLKYPFKLVGYIFSKFTSTKGIITGLIDKAKSIFGAMDDIDKQNRSMINKKEKNTKPQTGISTVASDVMAPSVTMRSSDSQQLGELDNMEGIKTLKRASEYSKSLESDEVRNQFDYIVKKGQSIKKDKYADIYNQDRRVVYMMAKIHEIDELKQNRDKIRKGLETAGFSVDDQLLEAMIYNVTRGKNAYGKGLFNPYQQNAPGNENIKYNIPGDTKVDTVAARACGPFAMGAAKDYVTGKASNMNNELKLGKNYLAPDDGTKFDYFKDSGSKSGLDVKQTSDMAEIDKATKDPNSAVVGMVDTGRGIHYETFTDKIENKGKSYYNTIDPEKPVQTLSDTDTIGKQLKTSFIVKRANGRKGIFGKGNEMRIDPQSTPFNCTAYSTMAMLRAYYNEENDDSTITTGNWAGIMDEFATETNFGNSESEKQKFINEINKFYDTHPNHPMLLYQTGGDGSSGNHPINHGGGSHATVIGRRLDNGMYEDYDPNGGIVHTLPLDEIFDPSATGGVQGMPAGGGNSVWIPKIEPSAPIDKWQGTGESSGVPTSSSSSPRTDENGIIYNNASANTNSGSIFDRAITNSAPMSNLTKLYNAIFGGDIGSSTQVNTPPKTLGDAVNSEPKKSSAAAQIPTDPNSKAELKHSDDKWEMVDNAAVFMSQFAKEKFGEDVPTWFWRTILRAESSDQGLPMNSYQANNWHNYGGMDYDPYMKDYGGTPATELSAHGHTRGVFPDMESGLKAEVAWFCRPEADEWWKSEIRAAKDDWSKAIRLHIGHYVNGVEEEMSDNHYMVIAAEERARDNTGKGTDIEGYNGPDFNKITDNDSISIQKAKLEAQQKYMSNLNQTEQSKIWNTNIVNDTTRSLQEKDRESILTKWKQGPKFIGLQDKAAKIVPFGTDVDTSNMTGSNKRTIDEAFNAKDSLEQAVIKKNGTPFVKGKNINQRVKDSEFLSEMRRKTFIPNYGKGYEDYGEFKGTDIDTRAKYIWSYLKSNGMSDAGAAGVIGNFRVEDPPLDPTYAEGGSVHSTLEEHIAAGGVGYGLAQWTYPARQDNLIEFAKNNNLSSGSLDAQLGFTKKEATEGYGNIWDRFAKQTDPVEAAKVWMDEYEAPGVPHWDRRSEEAAKAYSEFSGKTYDNITLPSSSVSPSSGISGSPASSGGIASGALGLIDKILLPAVDKAIEQAGYLDMIKEQYGIDVKASDLRGGNIPGGNISTPSSTTDSTVEPTSNGGAASGDSVGQAMLNFVPGSEITSPFGPRTLNGSADFHNGIDIGYAGDTPVYSPITAKVDEAGSEPGYGNYVVLKDDAGKYYMFAHLNAHSVKTGQDVKPGDQLGLSGNTGHSFGDHLHFGIHDDAGCLKNPETSHDPMSYPLGKGTQRQEEISNNMNMISDGLEDITSDNIDNYITAKRIESGKYGTGTIFDLLFGKTNSILPREDGDELPGTFKPGMELPKIEENEEEDIEEDEPKKTIDTKKTTTIGNLDDYLGTPYVGDKPNRMPMGINMPDIFGNASTGLDLGSIFTGSGLDLDGIFKGNSGLDLGNVFTGGLDLGGIFSGNGLDLGGIFKGGIGGNNLPSGGLDIANMFGDKTDLIGTAGGFIADWFNRRNERRKEKQKRMKNFKYYTVDSDDIPEDMPRKYLIDPNTEDASDKKTQKKIRKQFEFMDKNGYLKKDGSIKNGESDEEVLDTKLPDATKDVVDTATNPTPVKLPDHMEEEEARQNQEVKPPKAPKVDEKDESSEEDYDKDQARKDIVDGTGYHDHLEAKINSKESETGLSSDSNFEKLLSVLNIIAENTGRLVELVGNAGGGSANINMNSTSITAPPTSSKSGRNHINDMVAIANNFLSILKK